MNLALQLMNSAFQTDELNDGVGYAAAAAADSDGMEEMIETCSRCPALHRNKHPETYSI